MTQIGPLNSTGEWGFTVQITENPKRQTTAIMKTIIRYISAIALPIITKFATMTHSAHENSVVSSLVFLIDYR